MAWSETEAAARLEAEFGRITKECPGVSATGIVARAIAGEIARMRRETEVEVRVRLTRAIDAVPYELAVDETMKGVLK